MGRNASSIVHLCRTLRKPADEIPSNLGRVDLCVLPFVREVTDAGQLHELHFGSSCTINIDVCLVDPCFVERRHLWLGLLALVVLFEKVQGLEVETEFCDQTWHVKRAKQLQHRHRRVSRRRLGHNVHGVANCSGHKVARDEGHSQSHRAAERMSNHVDPLEVDGGGRVVGDLVHNSSEETHVVDAVRRGELAAAASIPGRDVLGRPDPFRSHGGLWPHRDKRMCFRHFAPPRILQHLLRAGVHRVQVDHQRPSHFELRRLVDEPASALSIDVGARPLASKSGRVGLLLPQKRAFHHPSRGPRDERHERA
mmetsp:Transcript_62429/g.202359  ORF Transcript_62429/g.202359 Transcript_62429/m.202359 type:complete len:310 (-) Transcript_62429:79-1008(-)